MESLPRVLVVEDQILEDYLIHLQSDEYEMLGVRSLDEALAALEHHTFDVVVTDLVLYDQDDGGMQVIQQAKARDATTGVIMVTGVGKETEAIRAISRLGARGFMRKPLDFKLCRRRILEAIAERRKRIAYIDSSGSAGFKPIQNPYMAGRPLIPGSALFYGRDEIFDAIRHNLLTPSYQNHLALIGPRRIGKTSILKQLPARLSSDYLPVYIDCLGFIDPGMPAFFIKLGEQIQRNLSTCPDIDAARLTVPGFDDLTDTPALTFTKNYLAQLDQFLGGRTLVLCLDEYEAIEEKVHRGRLDASVFEFLLEWMNEPGVSFILAGTHLPGALMPSGWGNLAFQDNMINQRIGTLPVDLARRLIEEPVDYCGMYYTDQAVDELLSVTGCLPYWIQLLCGLLVKLRNEQERNEMALADVQFVVNQATEEKRGDYFWSALNSKQQAVLIAACVLDRDKKPIHRDQIMTQLAQYGLSPDRWSISIQTCIQELISQGLLREHNGTGETMTYGLAFDLLGAWVRRHKAIDQISDEIEHAH